MRRVDRLIGVLAAAGAAMGLAWVSNAPLATEVDSTALLRLTWRARPERIEQCVERDAATLAALPRHMRQATICEGFNASYRLEVRVDGRLVESHHVEPGGLRRDRPLYVFRELGIAPGQATIDVTFTRVEEGSAEADPTRDLLREAVPSTLRWSADLDFAPRQVRVITYDPGQRALVEVDPAP